MSINLWLAEKSYSRKIEIFREFIILRSSGRNRVTASFGNVKANDFNFKKILKNCNKRQRNEGCNNCHEDGLFCCYIPGYSGFSGCGRCSFTNLWNALSGCICTENTWILLEYLQVWQIFRRRRVKQFRWCGERGCPHCEPVRGLLLLTRSGLALWKASVCTWRCNSSALKQIFLFSFILFRALWGSGMHVLVVGTWQVISEEVNISHEQKTVQV